MSKAFEDKVIDEFGALDKGNFHVILSDHRIFLCGGPIDATATIPSSFRERLLRHTASMDLGDMFIQAENFKDYFKESLYFDLLHFEDEIAALSSLIVIFLESPGSLVELGMFCSKPHHYKKLLIVAPFDETEAEDSFIYLGPLTHIEKREKNSVVTYPWPTNGVATYDTAHLDDLCSSIQSKLAKIPARSSFDETNPGHLALLICEIINLTHPVLLGEIELALAAVNIDIPESFITRLLYLLQKMNFIKKHTYSSYSFYYPCSPGSSKVHFGKTKDEKHADRLKIMMSIKQSFIQSSDIADKRRLTAQKNISAKMGNKT